MLKQFKREPGSKLTKREKEDLLTVASQRDEDIDLSDIPEIPSGAVLKKFYKPRKTPVTVRLDADVLAWLKSSGTGYQTRINEILRRAMTERIASVR